MRHGRIDGPIIYYLRKEIRELTTCIRRMEEEEEEEKKRHERRCIDHNEKCDAAIRKK